MHMERLVDAALALSRLLGSNSIIWGVFGGCAVALKGGPRESKDLDLLALGVTKDILLRMLDGKEGFRAMPTSRQDVATFIWNDQPTPQWVTVEIFVGNSPIRAPQLIQVAGRTQGSGSIPLLDEVYLFKGKLRACATRSKHSDAADLLWLEGAARRTLQAKVQEFNILRVGLAMKRYPHLKFAFERIGLNVKEAERQARNIPLEAVSNGYEGDVLRGLLG